MKESIPTRRPAPDRDVTVSLAAPESNILHDSHFGQFALHNGLVDQETLDQARVEQSTKPIKPLSEILVEMGAMAAAEQLLIKALLAHRLSKAGGDPQASISSQASFPTRTNSPSPAVSPAETVAFSPSATDSQRPHKLFGHYELLREIARGGMGVVYKARQTKLNRLVALKMIRSGDLADHEQVKRFYVEAEAAAKLDHPGIVPVYEVGEINGQHYFSMAFIDGQSLNDRIKADGPLPPKVAAKLLQNVAIAVQFAHNKGIVHRDIKPHNILLDENKQPRVADFGLAKQVQGASEMTITGQVLGTPSYMSPEQAAGKTEEVGKAADVYSLGATLYCLLTGRPPFQASSLAETIRQVLDVQPVPLRRLNPEIQRDLETICLKCLRKEPEKRYASARDLADDLGCWLDNKPITARPVGQAERTWLWCKRRPALVGLSLVFLVLSVVGTLSGTFIAIEQRNAARAQGLVAELKNADTAQVPSIVERLEAYRRSVGPLLKQELQGSKDRSNEKLHTALALLPVDDTQATYLRDQLLVVSPSQFPVVRDSLLLHREELVEPLWKVAADEKQPIEPRFQAACALATYAPADKRWGQIDKLVANHLVMRQASDMVAWRETLRPAKNQLIKPLGIIYRDVTQREQPRVFATETLADYAADQPAILVDLLADAEQFQYQVIFAKLSPATAATLAVAELVKQPANDASEDAKEQFAKRQANIAVALVRLGLAEQAWPLLKHTPNPSVRCYFIHWLSSRGADPHAIIKRLEVEPDVSIRRALVLTLEGFDESQLPLAERQALIEKLIVLYETESDAGLHAATGWLLRKWGEGKRLQAIVETLKANLEQRNGLNRDKKRNWYVNSQGQTMVILVADELVMGSPAEESGRNQNETQLTCKIMRRFAISACEVTKAQFAAFRAESPGIAKLNADGQLKAEDSPAMGMTWYEAAAYCNWLSQKDGLAEDQWCYEPNAGKQYAAGMKAKPMAAELLGYRLPNEAEWEYACRAGTITSRYYGESEVLLQEYEWYRVNSETHAWPVGILKPNDLGLFDMLGNLREWIHDPQSYDFPNLIEQPSGPPVDSFDEAPIADDNGRMLRGGTFQDESRSLRSAHRANVANPIERWTALGIRTVRTYPSIDP